MSAFCIEKLDQCYRETEEDFPDDYDEDTYCDDVQDYVERVHDCMVEYECEGEAENYCKGDILSYMKDECPDTDFKCEFNTLSPGDIAAIVLGCLLFLLISAFVAYRLYRTKKEQQQQPEQHSTPNTDGRTLHA